jgi:hypothetical protein
MEACGEFYRLVSVRHPDGKFCGKAVEKAAAVFDFDIRTAVLALVGGANFSAEGVHHKLQSVADAEYGQAQLKDFGVRGWSVGVVDRRWATGKNDSDRGVAFNFFDAGCARQNYRKNILFTNAARDELGILGAEVEDYDGLGFHGRVSQIAGGV